MAVGAAVVVGLKMAAAGTMPPLCETCDRYLRALVDVNGMTLLETSRAQADAVKAATGSRFVDLSDLFSVDPDKDPPS